MIGHKLSKFLIILNTILILLGVTALHNKVVAQACGVQSAGARNITTVGTGTSVATSGWSINLQIGSDGLPFITYMGGGLVRAVKCGNTACTAGNTSTTPGNGQGASSFIAANGIAATQFTNSLNPLVVYYVNNGGNTEQKYVQCTNTTCSGTTSAFDSSSGRISVNMTSAPNGELVLISGVVNTGEVSGRRCRDHQCTQYVFGTFLKAGGTINSAYRPMVLMPSDNRLILSYSNGSNLIFYKCSDSVCSNGSAVTLDAGGVSTSVTSMALGTNGFPTIAYRKSGQIKLVRCGNADCTSGNTTSIIDSATNNSGNMSVTVPSDNIPMISYYKNSPAKDLFYARCANTACTGTPTIVQFDTINSTDQVNMIDTDTSGNPGILYRESSGLLKYISCWDKSCSPSQPPTCTSSQPAAPSGLTVVEGDANAGAIIQTRSARVNWTFTDTGSGCGTSWGHSCSGQANQFTIQITGPAGFTPFNTTVGSAIRTYTTGNILGPNGNYTVQICAVNGSLSNCASQVFTKVAYPTGTITGALNERTPGSTPIACSAGVRASYVNTLTLTPNTSGYTTSCAITPTTGTATSYTCTITLNNTGFDPDPNAAYSIAMAASAYYSGVTCGASCTATGSCSNAFILDLDSNGGTTASITSPLNLNISTTRSFYKVKDVSYYDSDGVSSIFPVGYQTYDTDDSPLSGFFNRGADDATYPGVGVVISNGAQQVGAVGATNSGISARGWSNSAYTSTSVNYGSRIVDYIKTRKDYTTITSLTDTNFTSQSSGVFLINGDLTINAANVAQLNNKNVLLIVTENAHIAANLSPSSGVVSIAAKSIYINEAVTEVRALMVADAVSLVSNGYGGTSTVPLKVVGSIASTATVDTTRRVRTDSFRPSLFIMANPDAYTSLLPHISVIKYDWRQLQ